MNSSTKSENSTLNGYNDSLTVSSAPLNAPSRQLSYERVESFPSTSSNSNSPSPSPDHALTVSRRMTLNQSPMLAATTIVSDSLTQSLRIFETFFFITSLRNWTQNSSSIVMKMTCRTQKMTSVRKNS